MTDKHAATSVPVHDLIATRWSPRAFDPRRPVEGEKLLSLLEAARWAASCFNDQPWRYLVCDRYADPDAWERLLHCLAEKNQLWARNAPVLMLAVATSRFEHNDKPNRWAQYDTGAASAGLCLQAMAAGLAVHQMGGFDQDKARKAFDIPQGFEPMAAMAVGYEGSLDDLDGTFHESEQGPRERRPLGQSFFAGHWNVPIERSLDQAES